VSVLFSIPHHVSKEAFSRPRSSGTFGKVLKRLPGYQDSLSDTPNAEFSALNQAIDGPNAQGQHQGALFFAVKKTFCGIHACRMTQDAASVLDAIKTISTVNVSDRKPIRPLPPHKRMHRNRITKVKRAESESKMRSRAHFQEVVSLTDWRVRFRRYLKNHTSAAIAMGNLVRRGCDQDVIEELLYSATDANGSPGKNLRYQERQYRIRARTLISEAEIMSRQVRFVNDFVLPEQWQEEACSVTINDRPVTVPLEYFEYLPEILSSYSRYVARMLGLGVDLRAIDERDPDLMILATYLRNRTNKAPYMLLSTLLNDAYACMELDFEVSDQAVRKILQRYKGSHRHLCRMILELLSGYSEEVPRPPDLIAYIRDGLIKSHAMLYLKNEKTSSRKRSGKLGSS
jgi:hypothetical protein